MVIGQCSMVSMVTLICTQPVDTAHFACGIVVMAMLMANVRRPVR